MYAVPGALAICGASTNIEPALERKVDALRTIEPEIVAGMIPIRISDDELSRMLYEAGRPDVVGSKERWAGEVALMSHEVRASMRVGGESCGHDRLKAPSIRLADRIPLFGSTKVDVVDRVEIHVFDMPSKGSAPHAEVEVGSVDAWKLMLQTEAGQDIVEFPHIP